MKTQTINVNLRPCDCDGHIISGGDAVHAWDCASAPVLIPCPIPRSVTFEVVLGECAHPCTAAIHLGDHWTQCPARPIRVSCSISGKTWEESEVEDSEPVNFDPMRWTCAQGTAVGNAARERWALVKALVLDTKPAEHQLCTSTLLSQRNEVFSALADMARDEQDACNAQQRVDEAFPSSRYAKPGDTDHRAERPSVNRLARYVEHLIEQVGILGVAP